MWNIYNYSWVNILLLIIISNLGSWLLVQVLVIFLKCMFYPIIILELKIQSSDSLEWQTNAFCALICFLKLNFCWVFKCNFHFSIVSPVLFYKYAKHACALHKVSSFLIPSLYRHGQYSLNINKHVLWHFF